MSLAAIARDRIPPGFFRPGLRRAIENYCQLLAGTVSRVGLQAVYFFVLANTLSLSAMGIFASASAAGLMIASFSGLGFGSLAFRAAAGRPRLLGHYLGLFFGSLCLTTLLGLLVALAILLPAVPAGDLAAGLHRHPAGGDGAVAHRGCDHPDP
ncbi:MAG: hypothetical protein RJB58_594 [Pseudomonadota bacterium]|jgi:O-antigen/teichoic acid export membrane protein